MTSHAEYRWASAELRDGRLVFDSADGLARALSDGFFFVKMPFGCDLAAGDRFAQNFYLPEGTGEYDPYRDFRSWTADRLSDHEGYFLRDVDQVEQFFLESRFWQQVFPPALAQQARDMQSFATDILAAVLTELDIPRPIWDKATGGSLSGRGTYHLTFNHFRHHVRARGLNTHKDSGWVTVLRSLEPGLEVRRGADWLPITPRPDAFIVNFGCAIEILMRDTSTPVAAVAHRVTEQCDVDRSAPDRFSYALFVDSSLDAEICEGLYRYHPARGLTLEADFKQFLDDILKNTYELDSEGLY
ncbi:2OG-Fe(II) oxygenase family protein [Sphingobium sp.]|uniref:2OG-Fe(II) oxygenase family protein n=1 Tax=Sphingobium sp. TaxID=1912891 RepID=UPI000DB8208C|nr:2OG-Fe(II) oxygenase family protein [Sphingobium sp.]PZU68638.1 MAG: isopenicillin N synthase family oxygenase [Sphingobium sp.]